MAGLLALIYGVIAYAVFFFTFLYAIGFVGNLVVPKSIDFGSAGPLIESLLVNVALLGSFAVQHSVMARPGFKRWWTRIVPTSVERSTYVMLRQRGPAAALLAVAADRRADLDGRAAAGRSGSCTPSSGSAGRWFCLSTFLINHFELFGLRQVIGRLLHRPELPQPEFRTPSLYKQVRHPLYLGFLLAFWATPAMTVGHLLFAMATTGYILIAIQLEERDSDRALRRPVPPLSPAGQHAASRFPGQSSSTRRPKSPSCNGSSVSHETQSCAERAERTSAFPKPANEEGMPYRRALIVELSPWLRHTDDWPRCRRSSRRRLRRRRSAGAPALLRTRLLTWLQRARAGASSGRSATTC